MNFLLTCPLEVRGFVLFLLGYGAAVVVPKFTALYAFSPNRVEPGPVFKRVLPIATGIALVSLYWWETQAQAVSLGKVVIPLAIAPESTGTLHLRFLVHAILCLFLFAATYIDFEEMIIPDTITVPGTILGLFFAAYLPQTLLPATQIRPPSEQVQTVAGEIPYEAEAVPLHVASSRSWPKSLTPAPETRSLTIAVAIWWFWCFAGMCRVWYGRLPFRKALAIFCRYLRRSRSTWVLLGDGLIGTLVIVHFWRTALPDSLHWRGFLTALVGLFGGAITVWSVRLIGRLTLGREAMGFGDVTLMAMIGTYVGWQSCLMIFFLGAIPGMILGIRQVLVGQGRELPFGPSLCMGTVLLIVFWPHCWNQVEPFFSLGWFVPIMMLIVLVLLGVMLRAWVWIRSVIFHSP